MADSPEGLFQRGTVCSLDCSNCSKEELGYIGVFAGGGNNNQKSLHSQKGKRELLITHTHTQTQTSQVNEFNLFCV